MQIVNNVLSMDDGVKFLYSGNHKQFDYLTGKIKISSECLDIFNKNIAKRSQFCTERNIFYKHIIFPSKPVVLSKAYPELGVESIVSKEFMLDDVLYPLESYLNANQPFFKTDTHPTPEGSWEITKVLASFMGVNLEQPKYKVSSMHGDLNTMLDDPKLESYNKFVGMEKYHYITWDVNNYNTVVGNTEKIRIIKNPFSKTNKRLLVFGDSFFDFNLNEQLALIFNEVIFIRTSHFLYEVVDYIEPDAILSGQVERYVPSGTSDEVYKYPLLHTLLSSAVNSQLNKDFAIALNAVFSPKNSEDYIRWHKNISANLFRDIAISLEKKDVVKALKYMESAFLYRSNGPLIIQKIDEYKNRLEVVK